jgi:hypothetical protein
MIATNDNPRNVSGARNVFGLLLALWVSLAIQPCAMAAVSEHDCPHCPAEIEAADDSGHHHDHGAAQGGAGMSAECDSATADCCDLEDRIVGVRVALPDFDDGDSVMLMSVAPPGVLDVPRAPPELAVPLPQVSGRFVPLNIVNCVYLI